MCQGKTHPAGLWQQCRLCSRGSVGSVPRPAVLCWQSQSLWLRVRGHLLKVGTHPSGTEHSGGKLAKYCLRSMTKEEKLKRLYLIPISKRFEWDPLPFFLMSWVEGSVRSQEHLKSSAFQFAHYFLFLEEYWHWCFQSFHLGNGYLFGIHLTQESVHIWHK